MTIEKRPDLSDESMPTDEKQLPMKTGTGNEKNASSEDIDPDQQDDGLTGEQIIPPRKFRPPQPGTSIWHGMQRYMIGGKINQGNFGTVYHCEDSWGNKLVAKVLHPRNMTYDQVKERWLDEAQKLLNLRHPNTTYIHDIFEYEDTFYIVMEYCAFTIHDLITDDSSFDGSVWLMPIARCVLQAVEFMHARGYVHKDLHHKNIFASFIPDELSSEREAVVFKVGDFGISRLEGDIDPANTILAQWMLPPEALDSNKYGVIGCVTDIYHIGLVFLSILEGKVREFTREEILSGVPRQVAEKLDSPYATAIAKALRRRTNFRTQNALEFWRDLQIAGPHSLTK